MKIITKHILKHMAANRLISLLIVIALTVSTAMIYLNMTVKDQMLLQYKSILQGTYQDYNYYVYKSNVSSEQERYFSVNELNLSNLKVKNLLGLTKTSCAGQLKEGFTPLNIYGMDLSLVLENKLLVLKERKAGFDPAAKQQVIISQRTAEKYGLHINDTLQVSTLAGEQKLIVGGIAENKGLYLKENNKLMLFSSPQYVGYLNGMGDKVSGVYVQKDPAMEPEHFDTQFRADNPAFTGDMLADEVAVKAELDKTNQLLFIVLLAVILMVFYLNASNTRIIVAKRMPEIATFRSIGATRFRMNLILLAEHALYGLFGGIIGVVAGVLLKVPVMSALGSYGEKASYLNIPDKFEIRYVVYSVALTVIFQILVSMYGVLSASRKPIRAIMLDTVYAKARVSWSRSLCGLILWGFSIFLYIVNTQYNLLLAGLVFILILTGTICMLPWLIRGLSGILSRVTRLRAGASNHLCSKNLAGSKTIHSSITLVTVTLSIMLTIYLTTLSINQVFAHVGESFEGDIQLTGLSERAEMYSRLERVEGVQSLQPVYYSFNNITVNHQAINIGIFGMDHDMLGIKDASGKMSGLSEGEALIDEYYGPRNQLDIGDQLTLSSKGKDSFTVEIVGYVNAGEFTSSRNVVVISPEQYLQKVSPIPATIEIGITGKPEQVKDQLIRTLAGTGVNVQTVKEFLDGNRSEIDSLLSLINLIIGLSALIAFTGVLINQLIGFLQRKKEYAVLYSLGMSRSQLKRMVVMELAVTFVTGCLFAGGLGLALAKALEQILFCIGEYVSISLDAAAVSALLGGMFLLLMMASALSIRRIPSLNVVQELKYE